MSQTSTIHIPYLGGIEVSYRLSYPFEPAKPTFVLINSFGTTAELFTAQFDDEGLTNVANLIAIEPLGHGKTRTERTTWTYWDSAHMNIATLKALKIDQAFALGTSQGGFIATRMVLIAPETIRGILLLGTSLDSESERLVAQGSWNGRAIGDNMLARWDLYANDGDNFTPPDEYCRKIVLSGYGNDASEELVEFWTQRIKAAYVGEAGRQRLIMMAINLKERDGLILLLPYIEKPVLWMQGTLDPVFTVETAKHEIEKFTGSKAARLVAIDGGHHFLSASNPDAVNAELIRFAKEHHHVSVKSSI